MHKLTSLPKDVEIFSNIADIKETNYRNMLAISALLEILIEKGILTKDEFINKTKEIELKDFSF